MNRLHLIASAAFFLAIQPIKALEWTGFTSAEGRQFLESPEYPGQSNNPTLSGSLEIEFFHAWNDSDLEFEFTPFYRWDSGDSERTHGDIRELYFLKSTRDWEFKVGVSKVFWGVTESQHLVDIVNQTDLVENIDGEDKLGQPMIQSTFIHDWGDFSLFVLPSFRERTFPGPNGRLRPAIPIDTSNPLWASAAQEHHVDAALRWKGIVGDFDIGAHYFKGTGREPYLVPSLSGTDEPYLRPFYDQIDQVALDIQYTTGGWLWKLESLHRSGIVESFEAAVGGFEYTFYGVLHSATDVGTLVEYHYDSRGSAATTPFNHDIFAGTRITLNDEQDTSFIAGSIWDHRIGTTTFRAEFERRIGANYKLEIEFQAFANIPTNDPLFSFRRDSFVQIDFRRYF